MTPISFCICIFSVSLTLRQQQKGGGGQEEEINLELLYKVTFLTLSMRNLCIRDNTVIVFQNVFRLDKHINVDILSDTDPYGHKVLVLNSAFSYYFR